MLKSLEKYFMRLLLESASGRDGKTREKAIANETATSLVDVISIWQLVYLQ